MPRWHFCDPAPFTTVLNYLPRLNKNFEQLLRELQATRMLIPVTTELTIINKYTMTSLLGHNQQDNNSGDYE